MTLKIGSSNHGGLYGTVKARGLAPRDEYQAAYDALLPVKRGIEEMAERILKGEDIVVRLTQGPRAGTIARIKAHDFKVENVDFKKYSNRDTFKDVLASRCHDWSHRCQVVELCMNLYVSLKNPYCPVIHFDDRKQVTTNSNDYSSSWEVVLDHVGPTVYAFNRPKKTAEELREIEEAKNRKMTVLDQLGHEIEPGDIFFYGSGNSLLIGKLLKVSTSGVLTYKPVMGGQDSRIMNQMLLGNVREGNKNPNLIRYSKDLGDKIMLAKLQRL